LTARQLQKLFFNFISFGRRIRSVEVAGARPGMTPLAHFFALKNRRRLRKMAKTWKFGMTTRREQQWLRNYAAQTYRGLGAIVDLGCFLGATTIALAEGLALNRTADSKKIHAYDLFSWDEGYEVWAKGKGVEGFLNIGGSFLPEFLRRTQTWRDYIIVHEGDLCRVRWEDGPIEFLYIDVMKTLGLATGIARNFFPHLMPGRSYLAHQDYAQAFTPWIHFLAFRLRNQLRFVEDLPQSALFFLEREIAPEILESDVSPTAVCPAEIEAVFDYSLGLVSDGKKANVIAAKAMAYLIRGDLARAEEILAQSCYGPASIADEFNKVGALIEQKRNELQSSERAG